MTAVIINFNIKNKKAQNLDTYVFNLLQYNCKKWLSISLHADVLQQITSSIWQGPLHQADVEFLHAIAPERMADDISVYSNSVAIDMVL